MNIKKLRQSSISHCLFKNQSFLKVKTTISFQPESRCINLELHRKAIEPITTEL